MTSLQSISDGVRRDTYARHDMRKLRVLGSMEENREMRGKRVTTLWALVGITQPGGDCKMSGICKIYGMRIRKIGSNGSNVGEYKNKQLNILQHQCARNTMPSTKTNKKKKLGNVDMMQTYI